MDLELKDRVVVVTGGGRGIGKSLVEAFYTEGAKVLSVDREPGTHPSDRVHSFQADLKDASACDAAVSEAVARFGGLDVLVNNAGHNDGVGLDAGPGAFTESLASNLVHYYSMAHFARPHLQCARGAIVNIGSKVAVTGQGGTSGYAAAKGGVMALTREWALELAASGVRANAVLPAEVWTPLYEEWLARQPNPGEEKARIEQSIPLEQRFTEAGEIASTVVFLASPRAGHTTGQILFVDGGYTHLDRRA